MRRGKEDAVRRSSPCSLIHLVLGVAALLAAVRAGSADNATLPTFSTGVSVVNLTVSVTDARHASFVEDIGSQELSVFEDGVRQQIALFSHGKAPLSLAILIDGSASMNSRLATAQQAAMRLVRILGPDDEAKVVQFDRTSRVLQDFTSDVKALETAIHAVRAEGDTALYNAIYVALGELGKDHRGETRRRAIVLLTDGEDTASVIGDEQVLERARRAEVNIYTIGLRADALPSDSTLPVFFLTTIAKDTGGRSYFPTSLPDLDGVYARIAEELRTLYVVGYVSTNQRSDGKWRRIAVQADRDNLLVHHRTGYFAATSHRERPRLFDDTAR
jgi:Ca-activated chloride channel homolog